MHLSLQPRKFLAFKNRLRWIDHIHCDRRSAEVAVNVLSNVLHRYISKVHTLLQLDSVMIAQQIGSASATVAKVFQLYYQITPFSSDTISIWSWGFLKSKQPDSMEPTWYPHSPWAKVSVGIELIIPVNWILAQFSELGSIYKDGRLQVVIGRPIAGLWLDSPWSIAPTPAYLVSRHSWFGPLERGCTVVEETVVNTSWPRSQEAELGTIEGKCYRWTASNHHNWCQP